MVDGPQSFLHDLKYRPRKLFEQTLELLLIYKSHMYESSIKFPLQIFVCFVEFCVIFVQEQKRYTYVGIIRSIHDNIISFAG